MPDPNKRCHVVDRAAPVRSSHAPPTPTQQAIASRYCAGDSSSELAEDYDATTDDVHRATRVAFGYLFAHYR